MEPEKIHQLIDTVIHRGSITAKELAAKAGKSRKWFSNEFRRSFGTTYRHSMRRLRVYQALRMMDKTGLDNTEIAIQLIYSEESGMARDFRKVIGCSPDEARKRLEMETPEEVLNL